MLIGLVAKRSTDRDARRGAVETLLDYSLKTPEPSHNSMALAALRDFARADFSDAARTDIEKYVTADSPSPYGLWLAGQAGMENMKKELQKIAGKDPGRGHFLMEPYWTANLALARLGDAEGGKRLVDKVESETDIVQRVRGFGDLARTHHDVAVKYLIKAVMSEDELPPVKAGTAGTKVASYACDALARSVESFPLKANGPSYSNAEIESARKWLKEQKTLKFKP
jgi:hypothetical protein